MRDKRRARVARGRLDRGERARTGTVESVSRQRREVERLGGGIPPDQETLTYRPPTPTAAPRRPAPADLADEAAGFVPTGAMVADLREQCGCSVAEFADLIQVTETTVRRWEATPGPLNPQARTWEALLALYLESRKYQE